MTGVQTCALPISAGYPRRHKRHTSRTVAGDDRSMYSGSVLLRFQGCFSFADLCQAVGSPLDIGTPDQISVCAVSAMNGWPGSSEVRPAIISERLRKSPCSQSQLNFSSFQKMKFSVGIGRQLMLICHSNQLLALMRCKYLLKIAFMQIEPRPS